MVEDNYANQKECRCRLSKYLHLINTSMFSLNALPRIQKRLLLFIDTLPGDIMVSNVLDLIHQLVCHGTRFESRS